MENLNLNVNMENLNEEERKLLMRLVGKASTEKPKVWKPEVGERFWYIDGCGVPVPSKWQDRPSYEAKWEYGNVYESREKAEFEAKKRKFMTKLRRLSEESYSANSEHPVGIVSFYDDMTKEMGCRLSRGESVRRMAFRFDNERDAMAALHEVGAENYMKYMGGRKD